MFLIRDIFTASLFIFLCKTDGIITLDYTALSYGLILTFVNLFLTTRVSFCAHRLERCIQRTKHYAINSNFSSLGTVPVDSVKEFSDTRQIQYILAKYTKYQAAQDAYSRQPFENLSKFGYVLSVLFVPVVIAYWYFVDQNCQKILIVILPSLIIAALEEGWEKRKLTKERKMIQTLREQLNETTKEFLSREDTENVFSGNQIDERNFGKSYAASDSNIREESSKNLFKLSNSTYDVNQYMRYPNQLTRSLRFYAIAGYFHVIKLRKMSCLGWAIPLLLICIASGVLFIPIERESIEINANQNDLFIDFSIYNVSSNFNLLMDELKKFDKHFESIENLQTISNLYQSFQSFNQNESDQQGVEMYSKWIREEPINWAILTQRMESSSRSLIPNPFKFQFQYKFEKLNEYSIRETVQQIDNLLPKYSELLSPKASGVLYEHYHQMDVVWKRFAIHEILASSIVFSFISLIHFIFSITPNFKLNIIFSTFVIGTRLEFAAVFSLLSLEYHPLYANFAVLIGFLAAWTPYCDLARFRRRILYRAAVERLSPEIRESRRRIRVPFIAAADVLQFFGTILSVSTTVAVLSAIVPTFKIFLLPTVIFIGIQLCALMNSVAILLSTKQMFEQEVRHFLHHDLRGGNTSANICDLTRKKLLEKCKEDILIEMDQLNIRPIPDEPLFFSPPPKNNLLRRKCWILIEMKVMKRMMNQVQVDLIIQWLTKS
uniref:SSD domain-containing protein n=1 Tax=Caenorhabditis tropicalis TaxID=1561998 RepID=A0A1I7TV85_9PELO